MLGADYKNFKHISDDLYPSGDVRSIAFHENKMVVASDSKAMESWDLKDLAKVGSWLVTAAIALSSGLLRTFVNRTIMVRRNTFKRPNVIRFSTDGKFVVLGDKFGDVFRFVFLYRSVKLYKKC
jgi:hypothetical protein